MAAVQQAPLPAHDLYIEPGQLPKLRSNFGGYVDPETTGWLKPTAISTPLEEMRGRFERDGYLWVKNVMPREDVLDMRQGYFEHLASTGILKPGTSAREGIFNDALDPLAHHGVGGRDLPDQQFQVDLLLSAHSHPAYLKFLEHPDLRAFIREFMGWKKEVMVARTLLRHNVPHGLSTGIHYDRIFLRAGEAEFLTGWVPIGDCSASGGGLIYLENSTALGKSMEEDFMKRAEHLTPEERINGFNQNMAKDGQLTHDAADFGKNVAGGKMKWLVGNYEAGDVVFHNPYFVHGSAKNEDPEGRIRLSTDLRFYEEGAPLDKRWMQVWNPDDGL